MRLDEINGILDEIESGTFEPEEAESSEGSGESEEPPGEKTP